MFSKLFKQKNDKSDPQETRVSFDENKIASLSTAEVQNELFQETFNFPYVSLTEGQKVLHNLFILISDVDNGGYVQYLQNNKEKYFNGVRFAFKEIKFQKGYGNFEEITKIYNRNKAFLSAGDLDAPFNEKDDQLLNKLEQEFYDQQDTRDELIYTYLQKNVSQFFQDPR